MLHNIYRKWRDGQTLRPALRLHRRRFSRFSRFNV